jgi:ElaB/YqjD/DUF883 family membrane-anchored ribosome-binding protein
MRSERLHDNLAALRDQVHRKWSRLTKQDVAGIEGDAATLATTLAKRYSLSQREAHEQAAEFLGGFGTTLHEAAQTVGDAAGDLWRNSRDQVTEAVSNGATRVTDLWESGRERAEKVITQRPLTSLAIAAGVGAALMLLLRRR